METRLRYPPIMLARAKPTEREVNYIINATARAGINPAASVHWLRDCARVALHRTMASQSMVRKEIWHLLMPSWLGQLRRLQSFNAACGVPKL
jgi:hypothetical protein